MSSKNELIECFKKNICIYCEGECNTGITFTEEGAKCTDYKKIELVQKKKQNTYITADRKKPLMRGII